MQYNIGGPIFPDKINEAYYCAIRYYRVIDQVSLVLLITPLSAIFYLRYIIWLYLPYILTSSHKAHMVRKGDLGPVEKLDKKARPSVELAVKA